MAQRFGDRLRAWIEDGDAEHDHVAEEPPVEWDGGVAVSDREAHAIEVAEATD